MRQDAMTSEKVYLSRTLCVAAVVMAALVSLVGCSKRIERPTTLTSPYPGPKVWAVAPFRNESGTSLVDSAAMADRLSQQVQQVEGITVLPVNRVFAAMASMKLREVDTVADAMGLMQTLGADGLIVGTVTAWDPYEPPKIGAQVQLYARRSVYRGAGIDSRSLTYASTDKLQPGTVRYDQPVATAGGYFDAAHGDVMYRLVAFAKGRTPDDSPSGNRRYLLNMDLYSEFVSHELTRRLFSAEWQRLTAGRQVEAVTNRP